jgi:hypothetical protein
MKKNKWISFTAAALFILLIGSACKSSSSQKGEEVKQAFQLRKMALSILLYPEQISGSPRMSFNLILLDISGNEARENFFRDLLYEGRNSGEYRDVLIEGYRADYLKMKDLHNENTDMPSMNWEYREQMDFKIFSDRWIIISRDKEYYTGGAHGMSLKTFYTVDLEELKALSWEDLFTAPESPEFYSLILEALRERSGLGKSVPLSSGIYFTDKPEISPAFFPGPGGLTFHWNPYDITPYSEGHIETLVPWEKLEPLLSEYGREIAGALKSERFSP